MHVLVSAASKYGATREIAHAIAAGLRESGQDATVLAPEEVATLDGYDAVVLGSAVYAGHWLKTAKKLVERFRDGFATRSVWLFSSGPVGDPPKPEEEPVDVADIVAATNARSHRLFAGKIDKKKLGFAERAIVLALRVPEGDYRDWTEIANWAADIGAALKTNTMTTTAHEAALAPNPTTPRTTA